MVEQLRGWDPSIAALIAFVEEHITALESATDAFSLGWYGAMHNVRNKILDLESAASALSVASHIWDRNAPTVPYLGQLLPQDIDVARTFNESSDPRAMLAFIKLLAVGRAPRASALRGVRQQPQEPICKNCLHGWEAHINSAHIGDCRDVVADGSQCGCQHFSPLHTAALRGVRVTTDQDQDQDQDQDLEGLPGTTGQGNPLEPAPRRCTCWVSTAATYGSATQRQACAVHGDHVLRAIGDPLEPTPRRENKLLDELEKLRVAMSRHHDPTYSLGALYAVDEIAGIVRRDKRCRCGVAAETSHYCAALDHCWVGVSSPSGDASAMAPEEKP